MKKIMVTLVVVLSLCCVLHMVSAQLRNGFYRSGCPGAENVVRKLVVKRFNKDPSITAALLRMHFHDCFVRGCDASILIDSKNGNSSEKEAGPNETVRGYDLIDEAKKSLESACPSTVSCADIITLATRDAVALAGGPAYKVPTGRRDGLVSAADNVNLPSPTDSVSDALSVFKAKGFTLQEMVTLLGAHTVGIAHCSFFQDRISDFRGTKKPDPTMDSALASKLVKKCRAQSASIDPTAFLDQNTSFVVDNQFYNQIMKKKGILQIDQELALDKSSAPIVANLASNERAFQQRFAAAMIKLGKTEVLVGNAGEIRKNCRVFN